MLLESDLPPLPTTVTRDVEAWVENQMYAMPSHVKLGVAIVAVFITADALVRTGRASWQLGPEARQRLLARWAQSRLPPVAQYIRLERSLVLYAAHEHPDGPANAR